MELTKDDIKTLLYCLTSEIGNLHELMDKTDCETAKTVYQNTINENVKIGQKLINILNTEG